MDQSELDRMLNGEDVTAMVRSFDAILQSLALVLMYFLALWTFGLMWWKAAVISFVIWLVMRTGLARRHLERLAVLLFAAVVVNWSGLLPLEAWANGLIALITRTLA